jgi:hypothetical protein
MKCAICGVTIDSVDEAIDAGWTTYFYEGNKEHEPVCPECTASILQEGKDGEMEVKEKYRGEIAYQEEEKKKDLVVEIALAVGNPFSFPA